MSHCRLRILCDLPGAVDEAPAPPGLSPRTASTWDYLGHKPAFISQLLIRLVPMREAGWVTQPEVDVPQLSGSESTSTRTQSLSQRQSHVISNWIGCSELEVLFNCLWKQSPTELSSGLQKKLCYSRRSDPSPLLYLWTSWSKLVVWDTCHLQTSKHASSSTSRPLGWLTLMTF